jgi:hypothetical protein
MLRTGRAGRHSTGRAGRHSSRCVSQAILVVSSLTGMAMSSLSIGKRPVGGRRCALCVHTGPARSDCINDRCYSQTGSREPCVALRLQDVWSHLFGLCGYLFVWSIGLEFDLVLSFFIVQDHPCVVTGCQ